MMVRSSLYVGSKHVASSASHTGRRLDAAVEVVTVDIFKRPGSLP
ncbi:MAG: hypothetical protein HDKAJFGB_02311 [Anaerolineae bacterium]|nr:hypothetical protein [Anaerolineae bacterium]